MKINKFLLILSAVLLFTTHTFAVVSYEKGDKLNVLALSGLRLRAAPGGAVVASIPYGAQIVMLESSPTSGKELVENIPGKWAKASWDGKEGYVFDGFLSFLPAPRENIDDLQTYADQYFKKKGNPITHETGEEETHHGSEIQYYLFRDALIELRADIYYESYRTLMIFGDGVSDEEAFLLAKALYRKRIEDGIEKGKEGKFTVSSEDKSQSETKPDKDYYRFKNEDQLYELPPDCGFDEFGYGHFEGMLYLSRAGGC